MVTLASGIVLCGGTSVEDVRLLKARRREFLGWDAEELIGQERGEVTLAFSECADPGQRGQAVAAVMRPTCIHAGGETMEVQAAVEDDEEDGLHGQSPSLLVASRTRTP